MKLMKINEAVEWWNKNRAENGKEITPNTVWQWIKSTTKPLPAFYDSPIWKIKFSDLRKYSPPRRGNPNIKKLRACTLEKKVENFQKKT